jgi:hypothetical protein
MPDADAPKQQLCACQQAAAAAACMWSRRSFSVGFLGLLSPGKKHHDMMIHPYYYY